MQKLRQFCMKCPLALAYLSDKYQIVRERQFRLVFCAVLSMEIARLCLFVSGILGANVRRTDDTGVFK